MGVFAVFVALKPNREMGISIAHADQPCAHWLTVAVFRGAEPGCLQALRLHAATKTPLKQLQDLVDMEMRYSHQGFSSIPPISSIPSLLPLLQYAEIILKLKWTLAPRPTCARPGESFLFAALIVALKCPETVTSAILHVTVGIAMEMADASWTRSRCRCGRLGDAQGAAVPVIRHNKAG